MMQMGNGTKKPYRKERRPPRIPTPEILAEAALAYVAKFAATEASLRRVLQNRIRKAAFGNPGFAADTNTQAALAAHIETLVVKHRTIGSVNDVSYAGMKAGSLRRAGRSRRFIQQKLAEKGVAPSIAKEAIDRRDSERGAEESELAAAITFAKRKRLGRFRVETKKLDEPARRKQENRDLSALARNGFALGVARQALGANGEDGNDD